MNSQLTYRLYEEQDIPGLLRLWETNTEWGALTPEQWRKWYIDTPYDACFIAVGVDQAGEIRAQCVSTPTLLSVGEQQFKGHRLTAPILDKSLRAASSNHPIACLYQTIREAAVAEDHGLTYAYPNSSLHSFLRRYIPALRMESLGCLSTPLSVWLGLEIAGTTVRQTTHFGPEYQELWLESKRDFPIPIAVVRSPAWLQYKYGGKLALEVRGATGTLLGYTVFDKNTGLLLDCLARTRESLTCALKSSLAWLACHHGELGEVKAMHTSFLAPILDSLRFVAHDFEFLLGREVLNPNLSFDSFDLNQWHFMPGD
jgi:hypothetical protein